MSALYHNWTADVFENGTSANKKGPLGWYCEGLANEGFNFAKEVYIHRVIVTRDGVEVALEPGDFASFSLGSAVGDGGVLKPEFKDLFEVGSSANSDKFNFITSSTGTNVVFNRHNFNSYAVQGKAMPFVCKKWDAANPLYVVCSFSFGTYGNDPPHEFSGLLKAARFMPTIWFGTMDTKITAVRFDYRFHLHTDDNVPAFESTFMNYGIQPKAAANNFASIIRDSDRIAVLSCFSEFVRISKELLEKMRLLSVVYAEFMGLVAVSLMTGGGVLVLPALAAKTVELVTLVAQIEVLVVQLLAQLPLILPCVVHDLGQLIADSFQTVLDEVKVILEQLLGIFRTLRDLLDNYSNILDALLAEKALEWFEELVPFLDQGTRDKLRRAKRKVLEQIESLKRENAKLKLQLGQEFEGLVEQFIFLVAKLMNYVNFDAMEKPVEYEMAGNFVEEGQVENTWDNLHWWGTSYLPSAPGAFHAIHQHFRWARFVADPTEAETLGRDGLFILLGGSGTPSTDPADIAPYRSLVADFRGKGVIGGPLIDPDLPVQTIQFAVAKTGGALDAALKVLKPSESLVDVAKPLTAEVVAKRLPDSGAEDEFEGSDMVYWLSIQAKRGAQAPFKGTLLINGFYFAHDLEAAPSLLGKTPTNFAAITRGTSVTKPPYVLPVNVFRKPH